MAESIPFRKNTKEERFDAYLAQEHLHFFHKRAVRGEADMVVYVTALPVGTYRLLAAVITDNSIYTTVRCHLGDRQPGAADEKEFLEFLRSLNAHHAFFKYAMNEEGGLYADICLPARDDHFDPAMVRMTLNLLVYHLGESYKDIVKWLSVPGDAERELNGH